MLVDNCLGDRREQLGGKEKRHVNLFILGFRSRTASMEAIETNMDRGFKQDGGWDRTALSFWVKLYGRAESRSSEK